MISLNYPFNLESILEDLAESDKRVNITYSDDSNLSGFISQEYDEDIKLRYIISDRDTLLYHFIILNEVKRIDIQV